MARPDIDPTTKFLRPGVHKCSWADFEAVFVDEAPNSARRRVHLAALHLYVACAEELFPGSTLWVDGGFVSHKSAEPFDIDVLVITKPGEWAAVMKTITSEQTALDAWQRAGRAGLPPKTPVLTRFAGLTTLQGVSDANGTYYPRVQPFGGYIDGFIKPRDAKRSIEEMRRTWMVDVVSGTKKGFLEVSADGR